MKQPKGRVPRRFPLEAVRRVEFQSLVVILDGLPEVTGVQIDVAETQIGHGQIGLQFSGLQVMFDGFRILAEPFVGIRQIVLEFDRRRAEIDSAAKKVKFFLSASVQARFTQPRMELTEFGALGIILRGFLGTAGMEHRGQSEQTRWR